jgi:hypothetical protein
VVLFQRRPRTDRKLGTDRSEFEPRHQGLWGLVLDRSYGHDVYAKVTRKERDRFVCRADRSPTIWIRRRSLGVSALGAQTEAAEAKTFTYTSKYTSASTANGYPSPGGIAELVGSPGSMKLKPGGDSGDLIDHLTITEQLAPNKFAFKGKGIDNFGGGEENSGKLHHKFKGTTTVQGDGSQQLAIEGHWTWGHVDFAPLVAGGRYHGASGHYKGSATVAPESGVIVGSSKGKLRMHH